MSDGFHDGRNEIAAPLTTGEGNTTQLVREARWYIAVEATNTHGDYAKASEIMQGLLDANAQLREQLDAQEKGLAALAALARRRGDDFWLNALTKELLSIATRAAIGIGDGEEDA